MVSASSFCMATVCGHQTGMGKHIPRNLFLRRYFALSEPRTRCTRSPAFALRGYGRGSVVSHVIDACKGKWMQGILGMFLVMHAPPIALIDLRKTHVPVECSMHACEINLVREVEFECLFVDLPSTDDKNFFIRFIEELQSFFQRMNQFISLRNLCERLGNDDVAAIWERSTDRFVCFTPHDDRVTLRKLAKTLQLIGQLPEELILTSNDVVLVSRHNQRNCHVPRIPPSPYPSPVEGEEIGRA